MWADNHEGDNSAADPDLHVNFKLAASGESIGLFNTDGTPIDTVTFGPQASDVSVGRSPDGGMSVAAMTTPSPRAPNTSSAPRFIEMSRTGAGEIALTWSAAPNVRYRLQYRDDLGEGAWIDLGQPVLAVGPSLTVTDAPNGAARRFYRVMVASP